VLSGKNVDGGRFVVRAFELLSSSLFVTISSFVTLIKIKKIISFCQDSS
jgi:hypothetical protein